MGKQTGQPVRELVQKLKNPGSSLKWRSIQSTASILSGDIYKHGLRLVGNLIMTRLLFPEAFGIMLIINTMLIALEMLSDVGIRGAVILYSKNRSSTYLDTAWTMQLLRGLLLAALAFILAKPLASFYDNQNLVIFFIVSGFSPLMLSMSSPNIFIYQRNVKTFRTVLIDIVAQTLSMIITIVWLLIYPTVWALIGHRLLVSFLTAVNSYLFIEPYRPRLSLERNAVSEILGFGKWVYLSTALTYLSIQGDKVIMSKWLDTATLGIYSIASVFAMLADLLMRSLSQKLLFPVYSEAKFQESQIFDSNVRKVRLMLFALTMPIVLILAVFGDLIIELLYDERYHKAGWMLQVIAAGSLFSVLNQSLVPLMVAHGNSRLSSFVQAYKVFVLFSLTLTGGYLAGIPGLITGIALAPAMVYPVTAIIARTYRVNCLSYDWWVIASSLVLIWIGWSLTGVPIKFS